MKVHEAEGEYKFDNKDLEYKTKRITRMVDLEDKYKDKPKIAFHELSEEGNKLFMQAKRDRVWNTLGWSLIGNVAGIGVVQFYDARPLKRWAAPRFYRQRDMFKVFAFFATVGMFTIYGFGSARQTFVKAKIDIVKDHSIKTSS